MTAQLGGWDSTVRMAFRNAIAWQHEHRGAEWRDQVALYRAVARHLGLDLGAPQPPAAGAGAEGRLAAIRAVLARFDWESDDRHLALEEIERIAGGDQ